MEDYTTTSPPIPDKPYKKLSGGQKLLIGCGIGCGTLVLQNALRFQVENMKVAIQFQSNDNAITYASVDWLDENAAKTACNNIESKKSEWINQADQDGLDLNVKNTRNGYQQNIELHVSNLKKAITEYFESTE